MNKFYSPLLNRMSEGLDPDKHLIATYMVGAGKDVDPIVKAASLGIEQTTGSWVDVPAETDDVREKYAAKVMGVYEVPDYENLTNVQEGLRYYIMRIAYPAVNIDDNIPLLLGTIGGNITALPYFKILDVEFPKSFLAKFKGPKFGIQGVREMLGVVDRPLVNNMIKPCTGYTPDVGAELFYEAALGGIDIIKDDELLGGDRDFNTIEERAKKNMDAAVKADAKKGEKTMFALNITDEVGRLKENAMKAIKAGANCLLVNTFGIGLSALRMLAEDPDIKVPIMSHMCFSGVWTKSPYQGISSNLLTKLTRICGADIILIECPYGKFDLVRNKNIKSTLACTSKIYDIKTALPFYGGGLIPGLIPTVMEDAGNDCLLGAGAAVHAHPMGPAAGAKAMRQAIDAYMNNESLRDAAKKHEELKVAIDKWGIHGEEKVSANYSL